MYELDAVIDDEFYTIMYEPELKDNYLGEWLTYAKVTYVMDREGNRVEIESNNEFYDKCELLATEILRESLDEEYADE